MRLRYVPIIVSLSLLPACIEHGALPPEEVLHRSSAANRGLVSARLDMNINYHLQQQGQGVESGTLTANGFIQQGGSQLDLQVALNETRGRLIVLSESEVYAYLDSVYLPLPMVQTDTWYRLPSAGQSPAMPVTPDPYFLRMQSDIVRVVKDHGIETANDRRMYHYTVAIDPERLAAFLREMAEKDGTATNADSMMASLSSFNATGDIWVNEETFLLTQATWTIASSSDQSTAWIVSMQLSDVGTPISITAPDNAVPFPTAQEQPGVTILDSF